MRRDPLFALLGGIFLLLLSRVAWGAPVVSLTWEAMPGAIGYDVEVAPDAAFTTLVVRASTESAQYEWPVLPERTYHWRVRARYSFGRFGEWSAARAIPQAVWPVAIADAQATCGRTACPVRLSFRTSRALDEYRVEVARDAAFTQIVADLRTRSGSVELTPDRTGTYYWRVSATDVAGRPVAASAAARLTVQPAAPEVIAPGSGTRLLAGDVLFRWKLPALALASQIEVVRMPSGEPMVAAAPGASFEWRVLEPGAYAWRVSAVGEEGAVGPPSDFVSFEIEPLLVAGPAEIAGLREEPSPEPSLADLLASPYARPRGLPGSARVDVGAGWRHDLARASGTTPVIGLSVALDGGLSAGVVTSALRSPGRGRDAVNVLEAGFTAGYTLPVGEREVTLGAGPLAQWVHAHAGGAAETGLAGGALATLSVSGPLRSGAWFATIDARVAQWHGRHSRVPTGGVLVSTGWRFGR